jgi:hypothetical protein
MQIDRKALDGLLCMNDRQLTALINRLLSQSGIDPSSLGIDPNSVRSIRSAIASASDEDIKRVVEQYEAQARGGRS